MKEIIHRSINTVSSKTDVMCHIYYADGSNFIANYIENIKPNEYNLQVNICNENINQNSIYQEIKKINSNSIIFSTPNIGKDVGAKLILIDYFLKTKQKNDFIIFLQDKISPHLINGEKWKNDLMKIVEKDNINKILKIFETKPEVGIVCSAECISNEYDEVTCEFKTTNNLILKDYIKRFNFNLKDYSFVAGNMFWVRSSIYQEFFKKYHPLELRSELEKGNVMDNEVGTKTHSLERVFSWISTSQGFKIHGI